MRRSKVVKQHKPDSISTPKMGRIYKRERVNKRKPISELEMVPIEGYPLYVLRIPIRGQLAARKEGMKREREIEIERIIREREINDYKRR